jgi:branched-chain amino acid transport system ATP-binding protein
MALLDVETPNTEAAAEPAETILSVNNIEVIYDHVILVLKGVSLTVPKGGIVALLGANGAGKSTTLKAISNLLGAERGDVTKGKILFEGEEVQALSPNDLVRRGCIQVMEGRHCFGHLSIRGKPADRRLHAQGRARCDKAQIWRWFMTISPV